MSREEKKAAKAEKKAQKASAKYGEKIDDAYDESDRTLDAEDAHRDVVYDAASSLSQMRQCFMIQMKRFTKQKILYMLAIMLAAIPVVFFVMKTMKIIGTSDVYNINSFMGTILVVLPLMVTFLSCILCGAMLPQEFNERTVYLSLPLPMSRRTFFIGKFLAGFVLMLGVVTAAYGFAILIALSMTPVAYTVPIFKSLAAAIGGTFFVCAFAYMMSTFTRRGATMIALVVLFVVIPAVALGLNYVSTEYGIPVLGTIAQLFPTSSFDLALSNLGVSAFMDLPGVSLMGFTGMMSPGMAKYSPNIALMFAVCILIGILCLAIGVRRTERRDM